MNSYAPPITDKSQLSTLKSKQLIELLRQAHKEAELVSVVVSGQEVQRNKIEKKYAEIISTLSHHVSDVPSNELPSKMSGTRKRQFVDQKYVEFEHYENATQRIHEKVKRLSADDEKEAADTLMYRIIFLTRKLRLLELRPSKRTMTGDLRWTIQMFASIVISVMVAFVISLILAVDFEYAMDTWGSGVVALICVILMLAFRLVPKYHQRRRWAELRELHLQYDKLTNTLLQSQKGLKNDELRISKSRMDGEMGTLANQEVALPLLPADYQDEVFISLAIAYLENAEADNWKECVAVYKTDSHRITEARKSRENLELTRSKERLAAQAAEDAARTAENSEIMRQNSDMKLGLAAWKTVEVSNIRRNLNQ